LGGLKRRKICHNIFGEIISLENLFSAWREFRKGKRNKSDIQKLRRINKACVRDRVLHHAVFRILYPIFDKSFIFDSYSCRLGKGAHRAVNRLEKFTRKLSRNNRKNIFALKCDIRKRIKYYSRYCDDFVILV